MTKTENEAGKGFGLLFEMGCGKSLTSIAIAGHAYLSGKIKRLLIVAPTSVCSVWQREFKDYADFEHNVCLLLGDRNKRLEKLKELNASSDNALSVAVINYESVWRILDELKEWSPDMVIADESQRIKTHNAAQSKGMHALGHLAKYKLILTGTPVQNNAMDFFSQYIFLDKSVFGTSFYAFKARYAIMGGFNQHQIVGYKDLDQLTRKAHSIAYRVTKKEALDLPEQVFENRYITLISEEAKLYQKIRRDSYAEIDSQSQITANTVLTKLLRLQQLTGGFMKPDDASDALQIGTSKLNALEDIIDDYCVDGGKKIVVFARFVPEVKAICKLIEKKKLEYAAIWGDVKLEIRGDIVKNFQDNDDCKVFIGQIDTIGLGITLTASDIAVYYSLNFNYASYSQSLARIHRIGQRNNCTYVHLIAQDTVDEDILKALEKKEDIAKSVVDEWRKYF